MTSLRQTDPERDRLIQAVEQATESIIITDREGNIEYANPALEAISGYSPAEVRGQTVELLFRGSEHDDTFHKEISSALTTGRPWKGRITNQRKDGSLYTVVGSIRPVVNPSGLTSGYIAVMRDYTRELELADQLSQAQKMEVVGRLAGGIAHDFNNMLGIILGNTELILDDLELDDPIIEDLKEIKIAAQKSANLTRQLLAFSRRQRSNPQVIDLARTIPDMLKMLNSLIGEDIDLVCDCTSGKDLWLVRIDPSHVDQILANLAVNARDAIRGDRTSTGQGLIRLEIDNVAVDRVLEERPGVGPGQYVLMRVSDNGMGMDDDVRLRAFEPFFTTKSRDVGTGLGLSTVYGVVKQNGGFIFIDSAPGQGTTFDIYFPRFAGLESAALDTQDQADPVHIAGGKERILLVEDEASLLKLSRRLLEAEGYTVLAAQLPEDAIQIARSVNVDLLLTDITMPGMNGYALWREIQTLQPDIKVLFISGYSSSMVNKHHKEYGSPFLQKPYTREVLANSVRQVLEGIKGSDPVPTH